MATSTGVITLSSALGDAVGTTYILSVEASDGYGGSASADVTVTVAAGTCSGGVVVPDPDDNPGLVGDCETLLGLKGSLAGTGTLNWSGATAITGWDGVTVGGTPKRVTYLSLRARGLNGEIPRELGGLSGLLALWVHDNDLTGVIPPELGGLSNLIWMAVSGNGLTGEIPRELGGLSNLSQLWLQENRLSGEIPSELGDLTSLIILQMNDNGLSGPIPPELGSLTSVSTLNLSDNPLEGCLPPSWRSVGHNDFAALGLPYCEESGRVAAPGSVSASVSGGTFTVTWDAVTGAGLYEVQYRLDGSGEDWTVAATSTAADLTHDPVDGVLCETTYEFRVRAYGDGTTYAGVPGAASGVESVTTGDCSQAPEFVSSPYSFSVAENAATSTVVGTVRATDPDAGDTVTYTITEGNKGNAFSIGESSGVMTVAAALDHETTPSYDLTVRASDGRGGMATTTVEVAVTDVAEDAPTTPPGLSASLLDGVFTINWDPVTGAALYEVQQRIDDTGHDWGSVGTTTSTTLTSTPGGGPACGSTYEFRVRAYGDGVTYASIWGQPSDAEPVTTDACNRAPEFDDPPYSFSIAENAATTTLVGTVTATDPDAGDTVTYLITAGNEGDAFSIGESNGEITVVASLDHETTSGLQSDRGGGRRRGRRGDHDGRNSRHRGLVHQRVSGAQS